MKKLFGCLSILFIISNCVLNAQWVQTNGSFGTNIFSLAISGSNVFAGTNEGVYRSTNNGKNWTAVNNGLWILNNYINAFVVSGTNIFVGFNGAGGGGVYCSTNNGTNWTAVNNGLSNTYINTLAVSGTNLFTGTDGGVFLSTNNGTNWTAVNNDLTNTYIISLAVSGNNVFVGTQTGGVFLSTNNGTNWTPVNFGFSYVYTFVVSGANIFANTGNGIFLSSDNGTSWANTGLTKNGVVSLAVSDENLFVGTYNGVFFLSTNNGTSWKEIDSGLPNTQHLTSFAVSGSNLFAGTNDGIFLSTDNGANWAMNNSGLTNTNIRSLVVLGTNLFAVYDDGVSFSTDNDSNWAPINNDLGYVNSLTASGTNLFAGTSQGIFLSIDSGKSWNAIKNSLINANILNIAVSGTNLFVETFNGSAGIYSNFYISTNNGTNWTVAGNGLPSNGSVTTLATSGTNLFAGVSVNRSDGQNFGEGVYLSTNNGSYWTAVNNGLGVPYVSSLAVSGTNLFAGTRDSRVFLSSNNGTNWTAVSIGLLNNSSINCLTVSGTNLFAGTDERGVFITTDNGKNWAAVNDGLTNTRITSLVVSGTNLFAGIGQSGVWSRSIPEMISGINLNNNPQKPKPCPGVPTVTYAGQTYNTVQIGNQCWLKENLNVGTMLTGNQDQTNNGNIEKYCYNDSTIYCDKYGGLYQWAEIMQYSTTEKVQGICPLGWHIPSNSDFGTLSSTVKGDGNALKAIGQGYNGYDYNSEMDFSGAGTNISGFSAILSGFRQYEGKFSNKISNTYFWTSSYIPLEQGANYTYLSANSGSIELSYQDIFEGFSVRCINDSTFTGVEGSKGNEIIVSYLLSQNYPNPFNPTTTINYSVPKSGIVKIKVYDLLGREVAVLVNENKPAGNYSVKFNGSKFVSGIYFYRMESGSFSQTKKLLLVK